MALKNTEPRGSTPVPDPTVLTTQQLLREVAMAREILEAKLDGGMSVIEARLTENNRAIVLLQKATDMVPSHIRDAVGTLKDLHAEKFASIATQFIERDKRTEQLSIADKTAIAAALQAQKEAAGATAESTSIGLNKMENNFSKLIETLQIAIAQGFRNSDEKINDVKSRLDRGEGGLKGAKDNQGTLIAIGGMVVTSIIAVVAVVSLLMRIH